MTDDPQAKDQDSDAAIVEEPIRSAETDETGESKEVEADADTPQDEAAEETEESETSEESEESEEMEEEEEEPEGLLMTSMLDPYGKKTSLKTSIGKQAKGTGRNWYVIHTYSGYEDAVEKALRQRIESLNMHDLIFDVIVPKESAITIKKGEHVTEKKRLFPGYVLVDMIVTDESWYVVRNTPNVTGFVGSGTIPVPVNPEEFDVIKKHITKEEPKFKINFVIGEQVTISDGPFKNYEGLIDEIDEKKGKLKVLVTIFGRETPVELDFVQVKKK